jgi:microcystin-dependent protein
MAAEPYLGIVFIFAGNFAPRGYNFCQGQLLSIAENTALFSLLGTTYGGDGQTTFALPDLRGRAPISAGQGPGLPSYDQGEVTGTTAVTLLTTNLPAHTHLISGSQSADATNPSSGYWGNDARTPYAIYNTTADATTMNARELSVAGSNMPVNIQNPSLTINYIIAVEGLYPSRN